ncbi:MAG: hypothetical protein CMJ19_05950 [Phycisphaeraceae bacterium]|nr:hypothetical protein [Phycisphaeraceae bacterium]
MKVKFRLVGLLFFIGVTFQNCQKKSIDVYLIGGQSNATGQGYIANLPEGFMINQQVLLFHSDLLEGGVPYKWQPLCPASEDSQKFGVELSLGNTLQEFYPTKKIALIKHAYSGSSLYKDWNPGNDSNDSLNFGKQFKFFLKTVNKGLTLLREQGYVPEVKAMFWQQGEKDARDNAGIENSKIYGNNLNHFIHRVRAQFEAESMLFLYGYVLPVPLERYIGREEVRHAQSKVDQNSGHRLAVENAFVIETDDLPLRFDEPNSPFPDDKVHFNTYGILELGKRFAEKYIKEG